MSETAQNYYTAASIALKELQFWPEYFRKENHAPPSNKPLRALYAYIDLTSIAADEQAPPVLRKELQTLMSDTSSEEGMEVDLSSYIWVDKERTELKHFYTNFLENDKELLSIKDNNEEWGQEIEKILGHSNCNTYIAELLETQAVSLSVYEPFATFPLNYEGAKDARECGFLARVMDKAKGQAGRLIEPFVGGARVFLACDFASYLIADIDPALHILYTIIQQHPEVASQYDTHIKEKLRAFGGYQDLFKASVKYLNGFKDWQSFLTDEYSPEVKKDWARSYIFVRNHAQQRPLRMEFGNVQGAKYCPADEQKRLKKEKDALELLARRLDSKDEVGGKVEIKCQDWQATFAEAEVGDIIYADPPYAAFTRAEGLGEKKGSLWKFPWEQHEKLAKAARKKANEGIPVFISNWATPDVLKLYRRERANRIYTYCWKKPRSQFACLAAFLP